MKAYKCPKCKELDSLPEVGRWTDCKNCGHKYDYDNTEIVEIIDWEKELLQEKNSCPICHGTGEYHIGGSFGGPVIIHKCPCNKDTFLIKN